MPWACRSCNVDNPDGTRFCGDCGAPRPSTMLDHSPAVRLPEQRRYVTAVFADLSGFTDLAGRLDAETLSEVIGAAIRTLAESVDRYGGTVLNYAGDAVLAGFGIPDSSGDDAERALAASLDMRADLAGLLPRLPTEAHALTLHIGVNSGHAIARYAGSSAHVAYTVIGDAINVAQRLEAAAPPGEIFVGSSTAALVGNAFVLEALPPLTVKGKADRLVAFRLVGRAVPTLRVRSTSPMVGRDDVLADLASLGHRPRVVGIVGEPGIGKTTVATEAMRRDAGVRWLVGAAVPYEVTPYGPWRQIAAALAVDDALFWDPVPSSTSGTRDGDGDRDLADELVASRDRHASEARRRAAHARIIEATLAAAPVVVLLDDVQWADAASLDLVRELADAIGAAPADASVSLLLTARPEATATLDALVSEVEPQRRQVHQLDGLGRAELGALIEGVLGGEPDDDVVSLISSRIGGSPFFATELVRLLVERGQLTGGAHGWGLTSPVTGSDIPPTIEALVQGRLDHLDAGPRAMIEVASVIGTTMQRDLLGTVVPRQTAGSDLDALLSSGLLVEHADDSAALSFRHGIVRDVAYGCTLRPTRTRLHGAVADALAAVTLDGDERLDELAHHLDLADAGAPAVEALQRAARRAARLYANESAVDLLDRAITMAVRHELAGAEVERLRLRRASLLGLLSRNDRALDEFRELTSAEDHEVRSAAGLGVARTLRALGRYDEALLVLDGIDAEQATSLGASRSIVRASTLIGAGRMAAAADECDRALASTTAPADRVGILLERAQAYDRLGRADDALADAELADRLAREDGESDGERARTMRVLGSLLVDHDRLDEAERTLQAGLDLATTGGVTGEIVGCLVSMAFVAQRRGRLHEAIELDRRCVRELHRIRNAFEGGALANLAHKLLDAGRIDEGGDVATRAIAAAERVGDSYALADGHFALGRAAGLRGRFQTAVAELTSSLALLNDAGVTAMVPEIEALAARWSAEPAASADVLAGTDELQGSAEEHDVGLREAGHDEVVAEE